MILVASYYKYVFLYNAHHWKKKWSHFDLKSWVTGGTKIRPGIPSNWRMFESNWVDIENQFEIDFHKEKKLTLNVKSIWLKNSPISWNPWSNFRVILGHFDLKSWVKFLFRQWLNFLGPNDSLFSFSKDFIQIQS